MEQDMNSLRKTWTRIALNVRETSGGVGRKGEEKKNKMNE